MLTKEQEREMKTIIEDIRERESSGIEFAKKKMREQKEKMRSDEFKRDIKNRLESNTLTNNKELKNILYEMFPISELYIENVYIEEFARIYKESECDKDIFIQKFINIFEEYGRMGIYSNVGILRRELKVKYVKVNKNNHKKDKIETKKSTPFIEYKTQFQEVVEYEKFVTGKGGELMAEEYKRLGIK